MTITKHSVVSLTYQLRTAEGGEIVQEVLKEEPFTFLTGVGQLLPEFEQNINGLTAGDAFSFKIDSDNAYGAVNPEAVVQVPKDIFMVDGKLATEFLQVGAIVPMQDENGNPLRGIVKEVGESAVTVDFNHPMAGSDLHFAGEILEVRAASKEELDHGHVHGPGGHQH